MLVLTRKVGQKLYIGDDIKIELLSISGKQASLGIYAPKELKIGRGALHSPRYSQNEL